MKRNLEIARQLKRSLSEVAELVDLRLFGSRARGDEDEYSDMDVFVNVAFINKKIRGDISEVVWRVGFENYIVISPLIFTREELERSALRASPIVKSIYKEGIQI